MNKHKKCRFMSVITMGCRVNQFESELLRQGGFQRHFSLAKGEDQPTLIIVNTCSVTNESDREARQIIRRAARQHPQADIVVTGCYAQRDPGVLRDLPQVKLVLGNVEKETLWDHIDTFLPALGENQMAGRGEGGGGASTMVRVGNIEAVNQVPDRPLVETFTDRARAFLQLQDGCDRACTYCLIPSVRGPSRSLKPAQILAQAEKFRVAGYRELVLTGIDLGSYGRDLSPPVTLAHITRQLLDRLGEGRIRLSSIDPSDLDDDFLALFAQEKRICPHLHLSIQSGDTLMLKRMGRKTDRSAIQTALKTLQAARPEVVFGADMIVGFPTESEAAFQNSLRLVIESPLVFLHIFRYSDRPGTPAAAIPQTFRVSGEIVKRRSEQLRQAGTENLIRAAGQQVGKTDPVLIESIDAEKGWGLGKTASFFPVRFPVIGEACQVGIVHPVTLIRFHSDCRELEGIIP